MGDRPSLPPVAELARRELRLAGLRIDPRTSGPSRARYLSGLRLVRVADGEERRGDRPAGGTAPGRRLLVAGRRAGRVHQRDRRRDRALGAGGGERRGPAPDRRPAQLDHPASSRPGSPTAGSCWSPWCRRTGARSRAAPAVPSGPVIEENVGKTAPARTYQDLLDRRPRRGPVRALRDRPAGARRSRRHHHPAGGARHRAPGRSVARRALRPGVDDPPAVLVSRAGLPVPPPDRGLGPERRRRSTGWPICRWPRRCRSPSARCRPGRGRPRGARTPTRPSPGSRRSTVGTPAGGRGARPAVPPGRAVRRRPGRLATLGQRFDHVDWSSDDLALVSSWWWPTRNVRTWRVHPGAPEAAPEKLFDYSWEDRYHDPGDAA